MLMGITVNIDVLMVTLMVINFCLIFIMTMKHLFLVAFSLLMPIRCTINDHYPVLMIPDYKFSSFNSHEFKIPPNGHYYFAS